MSASLSALIPELKPFAEALVDLGGRAGVNPRVTSTLRSHSLQQRLYDAYLRGESKYPVAPPGMSAHEFGYAFDMIASTAVDLHDLGAVWRSWGGLWSPNDEVHFEYPGFNPQSVTDPVETGCDLTDIKNYLFWSPECACRVVDFLKAPLVGTLLSLGWPDWQITQLLSKPCSYVLQSIAKNGW